MTKEKQIQIMKPIKVLSLVLLALLLLVPAASAETYTLIDEDLDFGSVSEFVPVGDELIGTNLLRNIGFSGLSLPNMGVSYYVPASVLKYKPSTTSFGLYLSSNGRSITCVNGGDNIAVSLFSADYVTSYSGFDGESIELRVPNVIYYNGEDVTSSFTHLDPIDLTSVVGSGIVAGAKLIYFYYNASLPGSGMGNIGGEGIDNVRKYVSYLSSKLPDCYVIGGLSDVSYPRCGFSVVVVPVGGTLITKPVLQHVTVTYDDQTSDYTVTFDETTFDRDISVTGYLLGVFPLHSTGIGWKLHSDAVSYTVPARFLTFDLDYTAEVVYNDDRKSVSWNLDSLPETVTPPEPDPPSEPDLPDEPDPPDPTEPPEEPPNPPWYDPSGGGGGGGGDGGGGSFNGETFRESFRLPDSVYDLLNFDIKQIRSDLLSEIPIFEDIATGVFDGADALYGILFGFIAGTLVFIFEPVYGVLDWVSGVVEWFYDLCFGFMDFLYIPNHILSYLIQFVPNEILNLAVLLFALDISVGLLSILIPDIKFVYNASLSMARPHIPRRPASPPLEYLGTELEDYHSEYWGDSHIEGHNYDYHQDVTKDGLNYEWRYK